MLIVKYECTSLLYKITLRKSRWQIADEPWDLDLHDFKQLLQIFIAARIG
jgi:hypothetical protein